MKIPTLVPKVSASVRFSLQDRKFVPAEPGCYALASFDNEILYVGLATNLFRRFCQHREDDSKRKPAKGISASHFFYGIFPATDLKRIERGWMNQYLAEHGGLPPLNKVYSPVN